MDALRALTGTVEALRGEREVLHGPWLRARLMRWLRGRHHGCGKQPVGHRCDQRGRWGVGKIWFLSRLPPWVWTIGYRDRWEVPLRLTVVVFLLMVVLIAYALWSGWRG